MTEQAYQYYVLVDNDHRMSVTGPYALDECFEHIYDMFEEREMNVTIQKRKWP